MTITGFGRLVASAHRAGNHRPRPTSSVPRPTSRRTVIASRAKQSKPSNPRPNPRPTSHVLRPPSYVHRPTSRRGAPSLRAAENSTYVPVNPAKQSSAAVHRYVCYAPGTGLLRACNTLRIVSRAALAMTNS
ncbi:MAG: hypothetical protein LBM98_00560 [Oscillospiraceae bacterium]|nr:hypothetical protein [Oscillospiraceae bacterium]